MRLDPKVLVVSKMASTPLFRVLRGADDEGSSDLLVSVGRFLVAWWWLLATASLAVSTFAATYLAATELETSIGIKALWVISFLPSSHHGARLLHMADREPA